MRLVFIWILVAYTIFHPAYAQGKMQLRGKFAACRTNQQMSLWDISANNPLIRDDMLRSNYCWRTPEGLAVYVIQYIGNFARVVHTNNEFEFLVYRRDLENYVPPPKPQQKTSQPDIELSKLSLISVKNTIDNEVYQIGQSPTVHIALRADSRMKIELTIAKDKIQEGFEVTIRDQKHPAMQFRGRCGTSFLGIDENDSWSLKITKLDRVKRIAKIEVSGYLGQCSLDFKVGYKINKSTVDITGGNFDQFVRAHTQKELAKKFSPFRL